jgi:septum formation protein
MFILASASPRRKQLLSQIGVIPDDVTAPDIDESQQIGENPRHYAVRMAVEKAKSVSQRFPKSYILSADTVVVRGRKILHKANDAGQASEFLTKLSGRRHYVYGGVCLITPDGKVLQKVVKTIVKFRALDQKTIARYIKTMEWQDKAGAYAIQGSAAAFVESISGCYFNIVGLPLSAIDPWLNHYGLVK